MLVMNDETPSKLLGSSKTTYANTIQKRQDSYYSSFTFYNAISSVPLKPALYVSVSYSQAHQLMVSTETILSTYFELSCPCSLDAARQPLPCGDPGVKLACRRLRYSLCYKSALFSQGSHRSVEVRSCEEDKRPALELRLLFRRWTAYCYEMTLLSSRQIQHLHDAMNI